MKRSLAEGSVAVLMVLVLGICGSVHGGSMIPPPDDRNTYFLTFPPTYPDTPLGKNEMRISFFGTTCIPMLSQAAVSVLVELGNGDHFMFDAGTGVTPKYWAMGHMMNVMDKIFIAHLHSDHIGELPFIYGFGPYYGRGWPLYLWGPGQSGLTYTDPSGYTPPGQPYADGTADIAAGLAAFTLWHKESQDFGVTEYADYDTSKLTWIPPAYKSYTNAYDIVPIELDWRKTGYVFKATGKSAPGPGPGISAVDDNVAYNYNGVKITHFPAVHTRAAAVSYKLEWKGLSMIYAGDTLPNNYMLGHASGVDVLIHEIVMPAAVWNEKMGVPASQNQWTQIVQDSSHTPQKAFGYILNQLAKKPSIAPRLAVATHFQATDDTIKSALHDIHLWYPKGNVVIATDFMIITVGKNKMDVRRGVVSSHAWPQQVVSPYTQPLPPKYWTWVDPNDHSKGKTGDPTAQLDPEQDAQVIPPDVYNAR